jgi:hypothetical protein
MDCAAELAGCWRAELNVSGVCVGSAVVALWDQGERAGRTGWGPRAARQSWRVSFG